MMDKKELQISAEYLPMKRLIFDVLSEHGIVVTILNRYILCKCDRRGLEIIKILEQHNILVSSPALTVGTRYF